MDLAAVERFLRESIEDRRLTRRERKDLRGWIREHVGDAHEAAQVRNRAFAVVRGVLGESPDASVVSWLEDVVGLLAHHAQPASAAQAAAFFSPGDDCLGSVVGELRRARKTADVCVYTITDDRITKAIVAAARRGVRVRIVSDDEKADDTGSDVRQLAEERIPVALDRTPAHMHHKFAVFDSLRLLTGSFNWTRSASHGNHENLLVTTDERLVRAYQDEFDRLWETYG